MNEPRIRLWYNPAALTCPDETALHDFTEGRLSGPRREAVVAHVADCEGCRLVLAALARADTHPGPDLPAQAAGPGPGPGARIDRYRILGVLGSGGMGTVYAAYDPRLRRQVALKLLHPTVAGGREAEELAARLFREAHAMARRGP